MGAIAVIAAGSAIAGRDLPVDAPPPVPEEEPTTAETSPDAPLAAAPVGALGLLPEVPADRARDVIVVYDARCDAYMLHLDRPRAALLVDLPVRRSCLASWSPDGAFAADVDPDGGLVVRDRARRRDRRLLADAALQRGSARVDASGTAAVCSEEGAAIVVRPRKPPRTLAGTCPITLVPGAAVVALRPEGPLAVVGRRGEPVRPMTSTLPEDPEVVSLGASPGGRLIAVLGARQGIGWVRVLAPSGLPVASADLPGEVAQRGMRVAPRVEVDRDGSTAIAAVRQRAHVLRLTAGEAADVTRLGGETFLDATLSPDGRSVAVATGRRILILDATTLDPVAQVPFEALRVVWLDRTRLR